jgi:hypothetical protein
VEGSVREPPKVEMKQNSFDDGRILEEADDGHRPLTLWADELCLANIASGQKSIDVGVTGRHSTQRCELSSRRVMRSDRFGRRRVESSCSRLLPCATNSASSLVRMGAFAQLTGCFGCFWRGFGPGGGKRWCSSSHLHTALSHGLTRTSFVTLWNGEPGDGPGGTQHMVELVRKLTGRQPEIVDPSML